MSQHIIPVTPGTWFVAYPDNPSEQAAASLSEVVAWLADGDYMKPMVCTGRYIQDIEEVTCGGPWRLCKKIDSGEIVDAADHCHGFFNWIPLQHY